MREECVYIHKTNAFDTEWNLNIFIKYILSAKIPFDFPFYIWPAEGVSLSQGGRVAGWQ